MLFHVLVLAFAAQAYCGALDKGRIVGGYKVDINKHPYQVSLQVNGYHNCGGALLKPNVVLTAAHCTNYYTGNIGALSVRAGSTLSQLENKEPVGGEVAKIAKLYQHPKYQVYPADFDVSVLILDKAFAISDKIQTIQLISQDHVINVDELGTITGWGTLGFFGDQDEFLRAVQVPKFDHHECNVAYDYLISDSMVCYGYDEGGKDACQGDSGGPLVHYINGVPYVAAVVSWGSECASPGFPGVYADVQHSDIYDYIVSHAGLH